MADHAEDEDDFFIYYRGGRAPQHVTHVLIDISADEIEENAFGDCQNLVQVDTHDGIRAVGVDAFSNCTSLRRINLKSAVEIGEEAFYNCNNLESLEFGDRLEIIGDAACSGCTSLSQIKLPSIITIRAVAFWRCESLLDVEFSERLETIGPRAFYSCGLQRIAIPLKRDLFEFSDLFGCYNQFEGCEQLTTVDLVGEAHTKTIASLHMEIWRTEMTAEINRINQVLPNTPANEKTEEIRHWMDSVIDKMDHYKAKHCRYVKEGMALLELALWKANLEEKEADRLEREGGRLTRRRRKRARKEIIVTSGAGVVIKNVLPFLQLE